MIRDYEYGDINKINGNAFVHFDTISGIIENEHINKLVIDDGDIKAIVGFYEYHPECYEGFFILSKDLVLSDIKQLKVLLKKLIMQYKPKRLQTTSEACPVIDRWMEFMGFEYEGTRKKYMYDKDFKMWSIITWDSTQ